MFTLSKPKREEAVEISTCLANCHVYARAPRSSVAVEPTFTIKQLKALAQPEVTEPELVTEPEVIDLVSNSESDSESDFDESDDDRKVGPAVHALVMAFTAAYESDRKRRRR